jgi:hypothetical protein
MTGPALKPCHPLYRDQSCPSGVLAIYDNGGETPNRFTIFYRNPLYGTTWQNKFYGYRSCGEDPWDRENGPGAPREMLIGDVREFRKRNRKFQAKWSSLPSSVQMVCRVDLDL